MGRREDLLVFSCADNFERSFRQKLHINLKTAVILSFEFLKTT